MTHLQSFALLAVPLALLAVTSADAQCGKVLLKLDDMTDRRSSGQQELPASRQWLDALSFLETNEIRASVGLIGESLARTDKQYQDFIRQTAVAGKFVFFNHGYFKDVRPPVNGFSGVSQADQRSQIERTQTLFFELTGSRMISFGPHSSGVDSNTAIALSASPEIRYVWFYGDQLKRLGWKGDQIARIIELERPLFRPSIEAAHDVLNHFRLHNASVALQGHPDMWRPDDLARFKTVVLQLKEAGCSFHTPGVEK